MRTKSILFIFYAIITVSLKAQQKDIVFEQITNESGRSLGFITGIVQDKVGFMWFATREGLYRYNGYSYKLFKNNSSDSLSLPFNDITNLYYDNNYHLWMRHYDELAAFKNEKRVHKFDSIMNKHYDIEVRIVQDKKDDYWVAPTGNGIMRYQPNADSCIYYTNPPQTLSGKAWQYIDSLLRVKEPKASVVSPGNNTDTTVTFYIREAGTFLIASTGEIDKYGKYDFGQLYKNEKVLWELTDAESMWMGGGNKNRFEAKVLNLQKGQYSIRFTSDLSHGCSEWDGKAPDKVDFCGITVVSLSEKDQDALNQGLLLPLQNNTYISTHKIKDVLIDNNGNFWALSHLGLEKFNYLKQNFEHYPIDFEKLLGASVESEYLRLYQDKQGVFWIGSPFGLIRYDNIWGRYLVFQNDGEKEVLTSNTIYTLFEDKKGKLWIGTDKGLNIYDKERNTMRKITANNHNRLYHNKIMQIFEDDGGNIWVATIEGLNRLITDPFTYTPLNIEADNTFPAIYDESANIWYAINNTVCRYSRSLTTNEKYILPDSLFNLSSFTGEPEYQMADMVIDNNENIWVATDNRVSRFNILLKEVDYSKKADGIIVGNDSLKNSVKSLAIGQGNKLYAFCPNGFYQLNTKTLKAKTFFPFQLDVDFIQEVDQNYFKMVKKDQNGNFWIRTGKGVYYFNPQIGHLKLAFEFPPTVEGGPLSNGKMDVDSAGNLWFAALPNIYQINGESFKARHWSCPLDHDWGTAHIKVLEKNAWIFGSNGLYKFHLHDTLFSYYSVENGLVDNNINGINKDNNGYIWLTGLKGLSKFDLSEETSRNYFTSSDFTTHQFVGNPQNFDVPNGELLLFTTNGFVTFFPDSINRNVPKIVIDNFTIRGKEYDLDSLIYYKDNITLKHNQNFIGIEFAVLDYTNPALNKYKYRLLGLEKEWNYTDADNRKATYSGISPGKYEFQVKGSNNDKVWNEKGVTLSIIITPPWYKTKLAYIIYIVLIVSGIWIFIKVRERQLLEEKRVLEQKVKERTAEIEAQKEELASQNKMIAEQHKNITDSIQYAQRIQAAILPPVEELKEVVNEYFILYRPRDIVSGDYYWTTRHDDLTIIVAADCTGHGVPGAFMSMLGIAFLNEIVNKEGVVEPHAILDRLRQQIINQLHQRGEEGESKDGMDVSLYVINHKTMKLQFAGAYNPLYIIRNNELSQLKADRMPIGYHMKKDTPFKMQEMDLQKGDCLYNSSDGYPDQFGGADGRKFMSKKFKELLVKIHKEPMARQREILDTTIDEWRGDIEQIDDIIVIGVRV